MDKDLSTYLRANEIRSLIAPLSVRKLRQWARQGIVRVAKLGTNQQSPAMYRVDDVIAAIDAYSAGRIPGRRRRS